MSSARLVFDDPELSHLEVWAGPVPTEDLLDMVRKASVNRDEVTDEDVAAIDQLFVWFAEALTSWNLDAPATFEGVHTVDPILMIGVVQAWLATYEDQIVNTLAGQMAEQTHFPEV